MSNPVPVPPCLPEWTPATRVAAIRSPYPGVDALAPDGAGDSAGRHAAEEQLGPVVHLADRSPRPFRDGATRHAHAARIDAQNRVNLGSGGGG